MLKRLLEKLFGRWMKRKPESVSTREAVSAASEPASSFTRKASAAPAATAATAESAAEPPVSNARELWEQEAARPFDPGNATPEQLCGIVPRMTQDEIREQLALLYRRHTRAESSPDPALRHEAAIMLDVIAGLQEKYLGSALTLPDREGEE